jgi:hypothetical protein
MLLDDIGIVLHLNQLLLGISLSLLFSVLLHINLCQVLGGAKTLLCLFLGWDLVNLINNGLFRFRL